ncbi:efflux RND transporter permease subunit [Candidatus Leptofilum sp.]|uniref:efflux RND transporter permease subunit n=1 Tax=Candidatus Leptofilum sp. TaxID=3241576 RepID=UPI003B596E57
MLSNFFDRITRLSLRFRWITIALTAVILGLGIYASTQLNLELLPRVEFPQTFIIVQWGDSESSTEVLNEVTIPLEDQLAEVEGVLNVESTTNNGFAVVIVQYDFGLDQERLSADIEAAVTNANLPETAEPDIFDFSLSDLPVVVASVSSADLTLPELKTLVESDLQPSLTEVSDVSEVQIGGGQELPEEVVVEAEEETEPEEDEDPGRLPITVVQGARLLDVEIEYAQEITVDLLRSLTSYENAEEQVLLVLNLLPEDLLVYIQPEALSYLPQEYIEELDDALVAELDTLAAEFGGVGQYTVDEAVAALSEGTEEVAEAEPTPEPTAVPEPEPAADPEPVAELPTVKPVPLPETWIEGAALAGQVITDTSDISPEFMAGIAAISSEVFAELMPEMWRAIDPEAVAVVLPDLAETLEPMLANQLIAIQNAANGQAPEPVALPESWVAAAAANGQELATTADLNAPALGLIASAAPELLADLTPEVVLALPPELQAALPAEFVETLDEGTAQTLTNIAIYAARYKATAVATADVPQFEPVPLPETWIAGAAQLGQVITDTSDLTTESMAGILNFAPETLAELTPEMWRALNPDVAALALEAVGDTLEPELVAQLTAIQNAANGIEPEPVALPEAWVAAATEAGFPMETTADIPPTALGLITNFDPELAATLTPEILLALPAETLAAAPEALLNQLDPAIQQTIANIIIADAQFKAATAVASEGDGEPTAEAEPEPVDPSRLPDLLIQITSQFGFPLENVQDITPEVMRQIGGFGAQANQILQLLTPDNLRLLQPEVIALLPVEFLDTLPEDLRAELDELAAEFGGAGQLAIAEAEEAAALAEGAPALSGIWLEPTPEGEPPLFENAADLLNNSFAPGAAAFLNFFPTAPGVENPAEWMGALTPEVIQFLADNEEGFVENLSPIVLDLFAPETLTFMLETYPDAFDAELTERLAGIALGDIEVFVPEASVTRTDGNPSVLVSIYKAGDANTVNVAHGVFDAMDAFTTSNPNTSVNLVFEQATFIEDSIAGVSREGALGGVFAVIVILIFLSGRVGRKYQVSWQATLVTAVSIPLSIFTAFLLMNWVPPTIGEWLQGLVQSTGNGVLRFISQLFPTEVTLNIMTLSGLTVAIGRVVDDSIVVLENSYRYIQRGDDPKAAVIQGTREVAIAIFSATVTTMAVFLPLGLIGGIVGSFFLPFGLTVAYALAASYIVSITVVPALTYLLIRKENIPEERETTMQRWYTPALEWALQHRFVTMLIATLIFVGSLFLLTQLPQSFIPGFGEPTINVSVSLPPGTGMVETNELVEEVETAVRQFEDVETIQTEIGSGGGFEALFGSGISQNRANLTLSVSEEIVQDLDALNDLTNEVRQEAIAILGEDAVTISAASQTGFSGFAIIITGESQEELEVLVEDVKAAIGSVDVDADGVPDIANVSSNVDGVEEGDASNEAILRIDGRSAISFSGELETQNTLGVTEAAKQAINELGSLPAGVEVTEGFDSQQQVEGFQSMVTAIGYSIVIVYLIMALTFRSLIHPFTILFSLPFALVGAAIALFITNSVLGISAMIGLMMLVGIVVTNGIVLMELVQQLRAKGQNVYDALVEGGRTRLRPIWMTALTAILALIPLAASNEAGAIIASELARAVMGGLLVSTALTLIVVPVVYSLSDWYWGFLVDFAEPLWKPIANLLKRS